jgi:hypothetical protein
VIFPFGTQEQKQRFLARIANLDNWWCHGFSENPMRVLDPCFTQDGREAKGRRGMS